MDTMSVNTADARIRFAGLSTDIESRRKRLAGPYILTIRERNHSWAGRSPTRSEHVTRLEADTALLEYVKRNWEAEVGTDTPAEPDVMIQEYFSEVLEAYDIREVSHDR